MTKPSRQTNKVEPFEVGISAIEDDDSSTISFVHVPSCSILDHDSWEVTTDVSSVMSIGSMPSSSYRDALVFGVPSSGATVTLAVTTKQKTTRSMKAPPSLTSVPEGSEKEENDELNNEFDPFFLMEGVKGARGGRSQRMFKGNTKTDKIRGCQCSECRLGQQPDPGMVAKRRTINDIAAALKQWQNEELER